ncbi:MAG: endolytic transglycosylase MltG [Alphaproteobacteria bacterium]|nr:MAG: endolytic transglycosylase MltG [Alphaproteobacteria bacterium]
MRYVVLVLIAAGLGVFAFYGWIQQSLQMPGPLQKNTIVYIEPGSGTKKIAAQLFDEGAIESPFIFSWGVKQSGATLKAGEYEIPEAAPTQSIIALLDSGKTYQRRVTIPEGLTSQEIVDLVNAAEVMTGKVETVPPEGTLLPETYNYSRGDAREAVVERMSKAMKTAISDLWSKHQENPLLKTSEDAVTLASIVEKETALAAERPRVAGVFFNRLKINMPLQSDPTVIYALTGGKAKLGRLLTRADLDYTSPYNTYGNPGLPPGPIANPGRASLEAVMNPETNEYLYFVANGTGGHTFAKTLDEHNHNVAKWRETQSQQKP